MPRDDSNASVPATHDRTSASDGDRERGEVGSAAEDRQFEPTTGGGTLEAPVAAPPTGLDVALPRELRIESFGDDGAGSVISAGPEPSLRPTQPTRLPTAEYQLERLVAQRCLRTSGDVRVARCGSCVAVVIPHGTFFVRSRVLLSTTGNTSDLDLERLVPSGLAEQEGWIRIRHAGQVVLQATPANTVFPVSLTQQALLVRASTLVGFDEGLLRGPVSSDRLPGVALVKLSGEGSVVLETRSELASLAVLPARTTIVRPATVFGWWGRVRLEACVERGADDGFIAFRGQGAVFVEVTLERDP